RSRGARQGGMRASVKWSTVLISTGEEELIRSDVAHAGAQVRALQLRVDGLGTLTGDEVSQLKSDATRHYGHLGRQWVGRLLSLTCEQWAGLRRHYEEFTREYRRIAGSS